MRESNRNLIMMQWVVIAVLLLGAGAGGYLMLRHAADLEQTNTELGGDNDSLRRQLQEAKATPTPTPTPVATPTPTPTPVATTTPKPTVTPKAR